MGVAMRHGMSSGQTDVRAIFPSVTERKLPNLQRVAKMILSEA
jgi:hypothetical protein